MTTGSIGPGTVIAGRYRLDDLLTESDGARFWRATDTILARSVAIHAVPSSDPRALGLLEAARVSATVTDPHLLRVLDADAQGDITWVVNEWGEGISLDLMLQQGTLPPARAAWLTREVAEAIAAGHAQGVAHGRLNPEAVLVTHAGAVKLIGYVVDASLQAPRPPDPLYGELDDREADVINLAGVLYAALTGKWPGVAPSAVPTAPREQRRPLRPRQVRAGVPRTLDAICERVLHKEASQHALPIETAHEIAAALADYVGDPALSAPLDVAAMHVEPQVEVEHEDLPSPLPDLAGGSSSEREAEQPADEATQAIDLTRTGALRAEEDDSAQTQLSQPALADPDATQTFGLPSDGTDSLSPLHPPATQMSPPTPFPDIPERPLFASTERRIPTAARDQQPWVSSAWAQSADTDSGSNRHDPDGPTARVGPEGTVGTDDSHHGTPAPEFWPFEQDPDHEVETHTGKEGRGWLRMAIVVAVLLVLVVATAVAFNQGRESGTPPSAADESPSSTPKAQNAPLKISEVTDFDPFASPAEENPDDAPNSIDGDPATSWATVTYRGNPALGGLKPGVGLLLDLGSEKPARSVSVRFKNSPTSFEVYAAPSGVTQAPDSLDQLDKVATRADAAARANVRLDTTTDTRYVLVWLTKLPAAAGGFRGEVTDITVRS